MGAVHHVQPVKLICGLIAADEAVMDLARERLVALYGPIDGASERIPFDFTDYYLAEFGEGLCRRFVSFGDLIDPGCLASIKGETNRIEDELARLDGDVRRRRVNLDPGYVTGSKLVLATTKDFAHRIYLRDGIYAEVTLGFRRDGVHAFDWTYPDFRSSAYHPFLLAVRRRCIEQTAEHPKR